MCFSYFTKTVNDWDNDWKWKRKPGTKSFEYLSSNYSSSLLLRAGLRHWGPHTQGHGGPSISLPSFPLPSLPFPFLPSPLLPYLSLPLPSPPFEAGPLNTAMGSGERCKLPQCRGLVQSPSRQTIWCIFDSQRAALVAAIFCGVFFARIYVICIIFCTKT